MKKILSSITAVFIMCSQIFAAPFLDPNKTKITIIAANVNIGEIVKIVGGDKVEVEVISSSLMRPKKVELTEKIIAKTEKSNLVLSREDEKWVERLKIEAGTYGKLYKTLKTEGDWMIPYIHIRAVDEVKNLLSALDAENAKYYEDNSLKYAFEVDVAAKAVQRELEGASKIKTIANSKTKEFLESFGFEIVGSYSSAEDLTEKKTAYLVKEGKKHKVKIVVDNLQEGASAGADLAKSINSKHAVISDSILGKSYINTLKDNASRLKKAIAN